MTKHRSARDVLSEWPTRRAVAEDVGEDIEAVQKWFLRNSIPAKHFAALAEGAARRGIAVTLQDIALTRAAPSEASP